MYVLKMETIYDKDSATYGVSFCTVSSEHVVLLKTLPNLQPNTFSSKNNLMITAGKVCAHSLPHVRSQMNMSGVPAKNEEKATKSPTNPDQLQTSSSLTNYDDLYNDASPELQPTNSRKESHRASERVQ